MSWYASSRGGVGGKMRILACAPFFGKLTLLLPWPSANSRRSPIWISISQQPLIACSKTPSTPCASPVSAAPKSSPTPPTRWPIFRQNAPSLLAHSSIICSAGSPRRPPMSCPMKIRSSSCAHSKRKRTVRRNFLRLSKKATCSCSAAAFPTG